jgi:hypothetical protein
LTCQRAQGERNKAVRESWVRLCGTYQSRGGLLATPEVRQVGCIPFVGGVISTELSVGTDRGVDSIFCPRASAQSSIKPARRYDIVDVWRIGSSSTHKTRVGTRRHIVRRIGLDQDISSSCISRLIEVT